MSEDTIQVKIEADASDFEGALKDAIASLADSIKEMKSGFVSLSDGIKTSMKESAEASGQAAKSMESSMKQSAAETTQAIGTLSQSVRVLNSEASSASPMQGFASGMKDAMQSALALTTSIFGLHTVFDLFRGGIAFNAQMEQAAISFETMLKSGDKANKMIADLQKMAAETPFEFPDLQDGAKRMLAFGFSAESVVPTLTAVGDAAAGLGMSGKEGINRIVLALGQMQAKGKVSGEEMLQMTEAGIPAWDILAQSIGKTTGEVMKMSEQGTIPADKAIQALVAGMEERFPNMMQKQSKSFAGMMSTIHDSFSAVIGDIVKPGFEELTSDVLPNVISALAEFSAAMKKSGTAAAFKTILPEGVVDATVGAAKAIGEGFSFIRQHASLLTGALIGVITALGIYKGVAIASTIATAAQMIAFSLHTGSVAIATRGTAAFTLANVAATAAAVTTTIATEGLAAGFTALAGALNLNPMILGITLSIAALAACVYLVYDNWDEFKGWCIGFWNGIVDLIADNIGLIMLSFPRLALAIYLIYEYWDDGVKLITEIWESFTGFLASAADFIARVFSAVCTAFDKFADAAKEAMGKFTGALADVASNFIPDWAKSLWDQIVDLGAKLAAKTAEIGDAIRRNLKISQDEPSVGDFRRGEYENTGDDGPKKSEPPEATPIDWSGIGGATAKKSGGSSKKENSEYEQAKKLYDQQLRLAEYTAAEKEALYKKYLENVQKSDQEAMDYKVGLYGLEKGAFSEMLKGQETDLQNSKTRGQISEREYVTELAAFKKKSLDAEIAFRAKAMMEADQLTEEEKLAQIGAYKEKVEATVWYKQALKEVLNAEKTLSDFMKNADKSVADFRKQMALDAIALEEERLNTLYGWTLISHEQLIAAQKEFEDQRYALEKASQEQSLVDCANNADLMKQLYLDYINARDMATKEMIRNEMIDNAKSAEDLNAILKAMGLASFQHTKTQLDLDKQLKEEKIKNIEQVRNSMKEAMSQGFQDILTKSKSFLEVLKNIWSTTMKTILKQFTDKISDTITIKGFRDQKEKVNNDPNNPRNGKKDGTNLINRAKILAEQKTQAALTAQNAQGNADRLLNNQIMGEQEILGREVKAGTEQAIELAKNDTITASAQAAGQASVDSMESAITSMIQMLPMLILMSVLTGLFGGSGESKTTESTGPGINLGRNPDSYYQTPTGIPSFDVGSWQLPADTLAMVHKNEMIVPAKGGLADGMRNMLANGGTQSSSPIVNLSYSAAHYGRTNRDVQVEMQQNAKFLVKTLNSEYRNFNRGKK